MLARGVRHGQVTFCTGDPRPGRHISGPGLDRERTGTLCLYSMPAGADTPGSLTPFRHEAGTLERADVSGLLAPDSRIRPGALYGRHDLSTCLCRIDSFTLRDYTTAIVSS